MTTSAPTATRGRPLSFLAGIPVDAVKGIGPRSAKRLGDAGIHSVADLLLHAPRRYLDRSQLFDLSSVPLGEEVTVGGKVVSVSKRRISGRRTMIEAEISDGTNVLRAVWFNPYLRIAQGAEVALSGKAERFRGKLQMKSPDIDTLDSDDSLVTGRVVPIHPSAGGLGPAAIRRSMHNALRRAAPIHEILPNDLVGRLGLVTRDEAISGIHFPQTMREASRARERLVFDELFRLEIALALRKQRQVAEASGVRHVTQGELVDAFVAALPFDLTSAQARVNDEIAADLAGPHPMHRLLQGEVGSGKTVVAAVALLVAVQGGRQGAVMTPTEVLAEQHFLGFKELLASAGLGPDPVDPTAPEGVHSLFSGDEPVRGVRLALLTGNHAETNFTIGAARRRDVVDWIADGGVDLVVGTHALIQEELRFRELGVAVVDEQHRFGVYQRVQLKEKAEGYDPDLLIMTATPIPRTLSMTLYGDLDVSLLDEIPPGRPPTQTLVVSKSDADQARVFDLIRTEVAGGRQAFVVCPLVEDSDKLAAASATAEHDRLSSVFADLSVGLLHGQMRPDAKDEVMSRFRNGDLDVLVATTVIEVGIDVPNATVMVIEDADRFGLSQLHQLRGRVGRGTHPSRCVLVSEPGTAEAEARLGAMAATSDGFRLAEEDLRIRGQGTVFGTRQAGLKDLRLADILRDADTLIAARREAFTLVANDPGLERHPEIAAEIRALLGEDVEWLLRS
ncbi:MAG: ATP-dependent DNA helicase RecG [Acidimicrobiia bacterium]